MSPKGLLVLLVLGLCAVQLASAGHREERGLKEILNVAKKKLSGLINKAKDAARTSMNTVKKYIGKVEHKLLTMGTSLLAKAGIKIDLVLVAQLVKDNIKTCIKDRSIINDAKSVISSVFSCITKDVSNLFGLFKDMKSLWNTAKTLPAAVKDVSGQCKAHANSTNVVAEEPLQLTDPVDSHDLAEVTNEVLESASHHLSKRELWDLHRVTRCVKSVYTVAKNDLISIPGDILSVATRAYQLTHSVQGGMPMCLGTKLAEKAPVIARVGLKLGTCVATGMKDDSRLKNDPTLNGLAKFASTAASAMNSVKTVTDMFG